MPNTISILLIHCNAIIIPQAQPMMYPKLFFCFKDIRNMYETRVHRQIITPATASLPKHAATAV